MTTIRLGYQIKTGRPVNIPLAHTAVTGQTQQSGKTTTLEALVHRSGRRAIAFVTKRGEGSFRDATPIPPYFRDRADWEFVSAILEAMLGERMKFERSWIIDACAGAETLQDVAQNVRERLYGVRSTAWVEWSKAPIPKGKKKKPKAPNEWRIKPAGGLNQSVLTTLNAYLQKVVPILNKLPYEKTLELRAGLNVMDLSPYPTEIQSLVIRSVLEWVYEREKHTIVIIPEAWEFIPQNRRSPVLLAAEELIRKGGALENFLWLDSQDIAAVHKNVLRSIRVWILGVQREANEVKRTLAHIPKPPAAADLMQLPRGQFFASFNDELARVYVQPFWITDAHAESVARGEVEIGSVERIWSEKNRERKAKASLSEQTLLAVELAGRSDSPGAASAGNPAGNVELADSKSVLPIRAGEGLSAPAPHAQTSETVSAGRAAENEGEEMWKEKYELLQGQVQVLLKRIDQLEGKAPADDFGPVTVKVLADNVIDAIEDYDPEFAQKLRAGRPRALASDVAAANGMPGEHSSMDVGAYTPPAALNEESAEVLLEWLLKHPVLIQLLRHAPTLQVTVRRPTLALDDSTLIGKVGVLVAEGFFKTPKVHRQVYDELKKRWGVPGQVAHVYGPLEKLNKDAVLTFDSATGFEVSPALKIETVEA